MSQLQQHCVPSRHGQCSPPGPWHKMTTRMPGWGMSLSTEMLLLPRAPKFKFHVTYIPSENLPATNYSKKVWQGLISHSRQHNLYLYPDLISPYADVLTEVTKFCPIAQRRQHLQPRFWHETHEFGIKSEINLCQYNWKNKNTFFIFSPKGSTLAYLWTWQKMGILTTLSYITKCFN